ncbi:hypothetical protein [Streptomyces sporangiiformans]|uniref:DUF3592 domain-containing protein n=1 Tax=Streptomyces sporangiiformans TaxID=2315329 RepID=A0A505D660_9ACTN|nr:hypothetical protein [Streptomyces sporangiiformans]TPQ18297.1 hypothetical protein FGD71_031375 [Streptomyces sporangiiformans]
MNEPILCAPCPLFSEQFLVDWTENRGVRMLGILIFLCIVLLSLVVNHVSRNSLKKRGVRVRAVCVDHVKVGGKVGLLMECTGPDGVPVRPTVGYFSHPPLRVGEAADIVYVPANLQGARFANAADSGKWAPVFIAVVSVLVVVTGLLTFS